MTKLNFKHEKEKSKKQKKLEERRKERMMQKKYYIKRKLTYKKMESNLKIQTKHTKILKLMQNYKDLQEVISRIQEFMTQK